MVEEIKRKLNFNENVSVKEYLYLLAVSNLPEMSYLKNVEGNVFENPSLLECKASLKTASTEGYEEALKQLEVFKEKDLETLAQQAQEHYENKVLSYKKNKELLEYQLNLVGNARKALEAFVEFPAFKENNEKLFDEILNKLEEEGKKIEEPVLETPEEYRERVINSYEIGLKEYKEILDREEAYTIEGINQFVVKFMGVLNGIEENDRKDGEKNAEDSTEGEDK